MNGNTKKIKLTQGKYAIVDATDFEYINSFKWCVHHGYAIRAVWNGKRYLTIQMHRLINNTPQDLQTDHINHNKLDNRRSNLRSCTASQNTMNRSKHIGSTSSFKGVYFHRQLKKWYAQIKYAEKNKHLGMFVKEKDAALAYNEAASKHFGEFACLNIIS